jgi:hypothetical protein
MSVRVISVALLAMAASALCACGGGGGSSSLLSSSSGSGSGSTSILNTRPITIDGGTTAIEQGNDGFPIPNFAYVSVTICASGSTSNCQTIDHVQIDTQSVGLRIMGSVLSSSLLAALPPPTTSGGQPVFECAPFADGYSWGPLATANIELTSDETASSVPIQIIEDVNVPAVPTDCVNAAGTDYAESTPATFGANGLLGVGALLQDCGAACASEIIPGSYYACTSATSSGTCTGITMVTGQLPNPVAVLSTPDNNGVALALSAVSSTGAVSASGTLYLGVGTESNNALGSATVFQVDSEFGQFLDTQYAGVDLPGSVFDMGSNGYYFNSSIVQCTNQAYSDFYCPSSTLTETAMIQGESSVTFDAQGQTVIGGVRTGTPASVDFDIGNAESFNTAFAALPAYGGTGMSGSFDWGLPFFYGKTLFVGFQNPSAVGSGPARPYMALVTD